MLSLCPSTTLRAIYDKQGINDGLIKSVLFRVCVQDSMYRLYYDRRTGMSGATYSNTN